jgi:hypothetical protein
MICYKRNTAFKTMSLYCLHNLYIDTKCIPCYLHIGFLNKEISIGATDKAKEGEWRWSSSGKLLKYGSWYKGEPNNNKGVEDCAVAVIAKGKCLGMMFHVVFIIKVFCARKKNEEGKYNYSFLLLLDFSNMCLL